MSKFHVTKSGRTEPCGATVRACPLGEANHYDNFEDAARAGLNDGVAQPKPAYEFVRMSELSAQQRVDLRDSSTELAHNAVSGRYEVRDYDNRISDDLAEYLYERADEWASFDENAPDDTFEPIIEEYFKSNRFHSAQFEADEIRKEDYPDED